MSISEQILSLSIHIDEGEKEYYSELEKTLDYYHKLVNAGFLIPRGNRVQNIYTPFSFFSNFD